MRFITSIILIGASVAILILVANPIYATINQLKEDVNSYNDALGNSKALENARDRLTAKKNAIVPANLEKLEKLLPQNIENIRLILEIEKIAQTYGMVLKDVKYNTTDTGASTGTESGGISAAVTGGDNKDYGSWDLSFSTTGTYGNFLKFTRALENNLRIVDVSSIQFSSSGGILNFPNSYKYDFKIRTYWLK